MSKRGRLRTVSSHQHRSIARGLAQLNFKTLRHVSSPFAFDFVSATKGRAIVKNLDSGPVEADDSVQRDPLES
jgi:hypothetical protein